MARDVRYQIFVSSTYDDLYPVRRKVTEHILSMNHIPAGMEMFSASGRQQWNTIQKAIDNSDYYVLIVGERYGSISEEDGISYTEKEFNYAVSKKIPTLCFLPGRNFSTSREHRETSPVFTEKLEAFKHKVKLQLCDFWESPDELVSKVSAALYKIFTEEPGTGWIRGNSADPEALTKLVHVMEENNQLRKNIQRLEELNKKESPLLSLLINGHEIGSDPLVIDLPEPEELVTYTPDIHIDEIPLFLKGRISAQELQEFNASKPTAEQVDEHNEKLRFYYAGLNGKMEFSIKNASAVKANNVSVRIVLPPGIRLMSEYEFEKLEKPYLKVPVNIIEAKRTANLTMPRLSDFGILSDLRNLSVSQPRMFSALQLNAPSSELWIAKDGSISGRKHSVRQATTERLISNIYVIPERPGNFVITVELLCDEFREWQKSTLELIVS
ncbi:DUF4062 domain-containing protein [Pantoea agglomerans]|uniref:DUF4062 domain-containing protein n=1 Tax=Enterobacter agglomerans TaxID=549 RepID=UPI0015C5E680|nr:DUF4062 domain-containing protein [Pantoea agglomerans]NYB29465.1 DUF4062 domain-containing protein [Pantoea agglomerans]UVV72235.1 DUF4062 domain-containing protein [Pantoea agglomerans]